MHFQSVSIKHRFLLPTLKTKKKNEQMKQAIIGAISQGQIGTKSDASTQWPLDQLEELLTIIKKIFDSIN